MHPLAGVEGRQQGMSQQAGRVGVTRRQALRSSVLSAAGLALAACSPQASPPGTSTQPSGTAPARGKSLAGSSIRMGVLASYKGDAIEQTLPEFEKQSGIKVQLDKLPDTNLADKLTVSFASGSPDYDAAMIDEPWLPGLAPFLLDLDALLSRDGVALSQYVPQGLAAGVYNGQRVALPLDPNGMLLWYRKDLLEARGLKAPTNFAEIIDAAARLNDPSGGIAGISVAAKKDAQTSTTAILLLWNEGQEVLTPDGKFGFDSPAGIKALETYQRVLQYAPQGVLSYGATEQLDAFYSGKAAMVFYWASIGPNATDPQKSRAADRVGWTGVPNGMRGVWNLGMAKDSRNKDAAWELIKWMTGPDGSRLFTTFGGGHSPRYDVLRSPDFQQKYPWAGDLQKALEASRARPQTPNWNGIQTVIIDMTSAVLSGQQPAQDAVRRAAEQVAPYLNS
jgi:multiple sugar transport system substrate-binding protein